MSGFVLPAGTVTLLLADIEGSAELWETRPDPMAKSIRRHDDLVDELIGRHAGVRPKEQGEGDSFVAAFARPSEALACALAIQLAISREDWEGAEIRLRMALHTGEVEFRDEVNYVGSTINRCARLRDIAHGGQTLLSGPTHDLIADHIPTDASIKDLGLHRLRDLSRAEHVYQLSHSELREDFPDLRSLGALPNNLPVQLTSFVGREREIEEVEKLLRENRMLTLTGSGGCGKTRLALQVAADLLDDYEGGVWLADLSAVRDPALVTSAIVSALGLQEPKEHDFLLTLIDHLKSRPSLIVIDNCEHLIAVCAELTDSLLRACPPLTIVATSREPLGVSGETPWRVPSLTLPDATEPPQLDALTQFEAVRLFIDRAVKSRPNFKVTSDNAPAVAQICQQLDGIPLAIELAAARVKVLTPQQISEGLSDRFHLLTGGSRTAMARQQTLQASVDWSYDLLTEPERIVLSALSLFVGGFTLDAAEAVASGDGVEAAEVLDLLEHLVDKSLVIVDEEETVAARYFLLETIRQYAMERLMETRRVKEVRTRHMTYFLGLGDVWDNEVRSEPQALAWPPPAARAELDNFRLATKWARNADDPELRLRLATYTGWILMFAGHRREAAQQLEEALEASQAASPSVRARALIFRGWAVLWFDVGRTALLCAEEALQLAKEAEDGKVAGDALSLIGQAAFSLGDTSKLQSATAEMQQSSAAGSFEHIFALALRATSLITAGELAQSKALFEESIDLSRASDNHQMVSNGKLHLGWVAFLQGDFDLAQRSIEDAVELDRLLGLGEDPRASLYLAQVAIVRGDYAAAKSWSEKALVLSTQQELPAFQAGAVSHLALASLAESDLVAVANYADRFASLTEQFADNRLKSFFATFWADWFRASGDLTGGRDWLQGVRRRSPRPAEDLVVARATLLEAKIDRDEHEYAQADILAFEAIQMFNRFGARAFCVDALELVAGLAADQQSFEEAARLFAAAESARNELGYVRFRVDQPRYESDLGRIQEEIGDGFESLWKEGAAMTLAEAVAYALRRRGKRRRPASGWPALTPAELRVIELVAAGLANPKIAEKLFISRHTVESHLKNIFTKLGYSSRAELAAEAARRQPSG